MGSKFCGNVRTQTDNLTTTHSVSFMAEDYVDLDEIDGKFVAGDWIEQAI